MNIEGFGKEFEEAMQKVAETVVKYAKMYWYMRDILDFSQGYTPIEYARIMAGRTPQRIIPHSGSGYIPCCHAASKGMIWKNGRCKRRKI